MPTPDLTGEYAELERRMNEALAVTVDPFLDEVRRRERGCSHHQRSKWIKAWEGCVQRCLWCGTILERKCTQTTKGARDDEMRSDEGSPR